MKNTEKWTKEDQKELNEAMFERRILFGQVKHNLGSLAVRMDKPQAYRTKQPNITTLGC